jgi:Tfp pilus assembly protein PilN
MIKINLVPVKEKKKQKEIFIVICSVGVVAIMVLGMLWFYMKKVQVRSNLNDEIHQVDEESKSYQEKINEIKDLESKEANLEAFKRTIKGISETQRKVIVALDRLAIGMTEGVWLVTITQARDNPNKFTMAGFAFSQSNLQNFFSGLQKQTNFLKDVTLTLKSNSAQVGTNQRILSFDMNITVQDTGS